MGQIEVFNGESCCWVAQTENLLHIALYVSLIEGFLLCNKMFCTPDGQCLSKGVIQPASKQAGEARLVQYEAVVLRHYIGKKR